MSVLSEMVTHRRVYIITARHTNVCEEGSFEHAIFWCQLFVARFLCACGDF